MANELFPLNEPFLADLRRLVGATAKVNDPVFQFNLTNSLARAVFGHDISQGALKVGLAEQAMNVIRSAFSPSRYRRVTSEILGFDPQAPLLPKAPVGAIGAVQAAANEDLTATGLPAEATPTQ